MNVEIICGSAQTPFAECAGLKATYEAERMANPKGMTGTSANPKIARWADMKKVSVSPFALPLALPLALQGRRCACSAFAFLVCRVASHPSINAIL